MSDPIDDPDLTRCEAVQIAFEMEARGVLDPGKRARLERHVAECAECRAFRQTQLRTDATLRGFLAREAVPTTEAESRRFVAGMRRLRRRGWLVVPFVTVLTVAGLLAGDWVENGTVGHPREMCAIAALCLLPGLAIYYWRRGTLARLLAGDDVVAAHRRLLRDALRVQAVGCVLWLAAVLLPFVLDAVDPSVWRDRIARTALPVSAVLGLVALVAGLVRARALRRELARMR